MLSLGFRGNAPEHLTLRKAIIFHCERTKLCQLTPCSTFKGVLYYCKAWSWNPVIPWAGSASAATFPAAGSPSANVPSADCRDSPEFTFLRGFCSPPQDGKLPVVCHLSPALGHTKLCSSSDLQSICVWDTDTMGWSCIGQCEGWWWNSWAPEP